MENRKYIAIDLKSFYASVECRERGLDPLDTNLVVADKSRTDKTICLAVTPSLKSYGISGLARLFEVKQQVKEANAGRRHDAPGHKLEGSSCLYSELAANPKLAIDFIIAPPRMPYYMEYSTRIYSIYMKYIAPEDIIVYSIDEVFMDVTNYLNTYKLSAHDLAIKIIHDVLDNTGITATAGIGTNLYLAKIAMDIVAKHSHGTINLGKHTSSTKQIMEATSELFDRIVDRSLLIRRLNITANHVIDKASIKQEPRYEQLDLFTDYAALQAKQEKEQAQLEREKKMRKAMLTIKKKFGKNAILKGMNLEEGATARDRNAQIGGHKA